MYTSIDISSQISALRGVPCPTNKGVSYTNLVVGLAVTLKINYYYYYYYSDSCEIVWFNAKFKIYT